MSLVELRPAGLYCSLGDFYVDPWRGVERAVITHAHSDHARWGSAAYLCAERGAALLAARVNGANIQGHRYGEPLTVGDVQVSFHPAGHVLGSAQIRIEHKGLRWVVSGDYTIAPNRAADAFEPVRCEGFVTEATFALPIYRWKRAEEVYGEINEWWRANGAAGKASILYGYALGKAQRLLAGLDASIGPIYTHGAVERLTGIYREAGVELPATTYAMEGNRRDFAGAMVIAPPGMNGSAWVRRFGDFATGLASGWMAVRGQRRRRAVDRGFVLSDHADWPGLLEAIRLTGAEKVWVTHGYIDPLVEWLRGQGYDAAGLATQYGGDGDEDETEAPAGDGE